MEKKATLLAVASYYIHAIWILLEKNRIYIKICLK